MRVRAHPRDQGGSLVGAASAEKRRAKASPLPDLSFKGCLASAESRDVEQRILLGQASAREDARPNRHTARGVLSRLRSVGVIANVLRRRGEENALRDVFVERRAVRAGPEMGYRDDSARLVGDESAASNHFGVGARAGVALLPLDALDALDALITLRPLSAGIALVALRPLRAGSPCVPLRPLRAGRELPGLELRGRQRAVLDLGAGDRVGLQLP
jgi:hypothetical protein